MRARRTIGLGLLAAALVAAAAVVFWLSVPRLEATGPAEITRDSTPRIWASFSVPAAALDNARFAARIDGTDVSGNARLRGSGIVIDGIELGDGRHEVEVDLMDTGVLRLDTTERFTITVDRTPPALDIESPAAHHLQTTEPDLQFEIATDPNATLYAVGGRRLERYVAGDTGEVAGRYRLRPAAQEVRFIAVDEAGNRTVDEVQVVLDALAPKVRLSGPTTLSDTSDPLVLEVRDHSPARVATVLLAGEHIDFTTEGTGAVAAAATDGKETTSAPVMYTAPMTVTVAASPELAEGEHELVVEAEDSFGNRRRRTMTVLVDTTDDLGEVLAVGPGARGDDVRELQQRLTEKGYFAPDSRLGRFEWRQFRFGPETAEAVRRAQETAGITPDGVAGQDTLGSLLYRVSIDRAANTLTLYRLGEVVKVFRVSTGTAQHPTPTGQFRVIDKQANPTWNPPDSDWAKDAKPIPPGPGNPLGTRWMGLDSPAIGIHGTPDAASLGYSRSHGCIRMAISEAEELFDIIGLGTPVEIV